MAQIITQLRHPRGRGRILDDAEVSLSAYLSKDSIAVGNSQVRDARVDDRSTIADNARVFGGRLYHTYAGSNIVVAGNPSISNSILTGRSITGNAYLSFVATKDFSEIADGCTILGRSITEPIVIEDAACVYGEARLTGHFFVNKKMRICDGVWSRAPRHVDLGYAAVTESALGALVDCRNRTVDYWNEHGPKLAERWGYSSAQIQEMLAAVNECSAPLHSR